MCLDHLMALTVRVAGFGVDKVSSMLKNRESSILYSTNTSTIAMKTT